MAMTQHGSWSDVDALLDQADEFARAGDGLEAQARARRARDRLDDSSAASTRARVSWTLRRCDALALECQAENAARSAAHVAGERRAIGAERPEPAVRASAWSEAGAWLRRAFG
jgi:hypothetical protein